MPPAVAPTEWESATMLSFMARFPLRQFGADLLAEIVCEVVLIGGGAMDIIEVSIAGNSLVDGAPQLPRRWRPLESQLYGSWRRCSDGDQQIIAGGVLGADNQRRRAPQTGERGMTERESLRQCRS